MTEEGKKLIDRFETNLRHLMYLHDTLKRENAELRQQLQLKEDECKQVAESYKALEISYARLKTAATIRLQAGDVKETKRRLSRLVREVDKCITLLNG